MRNKKRMLAILDDTVNFYGADPKGRRGISGAGFCCYCTDFKNLDYAKKCSIGRLLTDEDLNIVDKRGVNKGSVIGLINFFKLKGLAGLELIFLSQLQGLHDSARCWNLFGGGLTDFGEERKQTIEKYLYPKGVPANAR